MRSISLAVFLSALPLVFSHSLLLSVEGANGVTGKGFGSSDTVPRDGNSQQDSVQFQGSSTGCGQNQLFGVIDIATDLKDAIASGLPTVGTDGSIAVTIHQVNGDGAGPYACEVDPTGTGNNFVAMTVTQNVPGNNGNSNEVATNHPLTAVLPEGTTCSGTGGACLVRCVQTNGRFGGCAAVTTNNAVAAPPVAVSSSVSADGTSTEVEVASSTSSSTSTSVAAVTTVAGTASGGGKRVCTRKAKLTSATPTVNAVASASTSTAENAVATSSAAVVSTGSGKKVCSKKGRQNAATAIASAATSKVTSKKTSKAVKSKTRTAAAAVSTSVEASASTTTTKAASAVTSSASGKKVCSKKASTTAASSATTSAAAVTKGNTSATTGKCVRSKSRLIMKSRLMRRSRA